MNKQLLLILLALTCSKAHFANVCIAGGGPENVALVVNEDSQSSLTIANHFVQLRDIPEINVIYLSQIPDSETISVADCRAKILQPIFSILEKRKLLDHIDYVVYSSDFPTAVTLPAKANDCLPKDIRKYFLTTASLNAATFFMQQVMAEDYTFLQMTSNFYMRQSLEAAIANYYVGPAKAKYQELLDHYESGEFDLALSKAEEFTKSRFPRPVMRYWQARCLAQLGKKDDAFATLQTAIQQGWAFGDPTASDAAFEILSSEERFKSLIATIDNPTAIQPSLGFRSNDTWRPNGMRTANPVEGRKYLLSMMLGCTRGKGNSVDEVVAALKRSAHADGTNPNGTFYYVSNAGIRSKTRAPYFQEAIDSLKKQGRVAEIVSDAMPKDKSDILGAMTGIASFDFSKSGSKIKPGAICDNLTSYGGKMAGKRGKGQTTVSEFIAHGAAGASGTVVEPYTVPHKFPHPMIHYHYSQGCSLAEAFYQSVHSPYQLLIVGDPLCQPFAKFPQFTVDGLEDKMTISGKIKVSMNQTADSFPIASYEFFYNGKKIKTLLPDGTINFDSTKVNSGYCEFRIVAVAKNRIQTRTSKTFGVVVQNDRGKFEVTPERTEYKSSDQIEFAFPAIKSANIIVINNSREVGRSDKAGNLSIDCAKLGLGPVRLKVVAIKSIETKDSSTENTATKRSQSIQCRPFYVNVTKD